MNKETYYPNTKTGGLDLSELLKKGQNEFTREMVTSASGRILLFEASPKEILLRDADSEADYWMFSAIDSSRCVTFDLHTRRNGKGFRLLYQPFAVHPDFFAGRFIGLSIDHFKKTGDVDGIKGKWHSKGINYNQFMNSYLKEEDKVKAALSTWSGKTYTNYGFGDLKDDAIFMHTERANPMIEALFKKVK